MSLLARSHYKREFLQKGMYAIEPHENIHTNLVSLPNNRKPPTQTFVTVQTNECVGNEKKILFWYNFTTMK